MLSFDAFFSSFPLAESPPRDLQITVYAFSSPEPTILMACGRNRELWEQPFWNNKGNNRILPIRFNSVFIYGACPKWLLPELSIPAAGQKDRRLWGRECCLRIMVCSCVVPSKRVLLQIICCSCVIGTTFSREKWQIASLSCQEVIKRWKQTWWSNDKTIIELGYRKISWFVSGEQINYLPQPSASANNWSARHWQIPIFCSTSSNNC